MTTMLVLSLRQLAGGRRAWIMLLLAAIPLLFALIYRLAGGEETPTEFGDGLTSHLIVSTILPLMMLVLATAAFGNELDDRTLPYLILKPLPRWKIVLPKLLAPLLVGGVPVVVSGYLATLIVTEGDVGYALTTAAALLVGATAYAALFTWAGLAIRYALPFGVAYIFVWEAALSTFLGGTRFLSVRQYTLAVVHGLDDSRLARETIGLDLPGALIGAVLVVIASLVLTTRRLSRMDIP
ncbi:MAG TPA: ABC transporter permease subunit [Dehalococcoidia bacterium]|nr:ABC transporter permease subunit [Dehalococcoidia bacterium]